MSEELRAAQITAHARFRAESQKLDEDLSLPFAQTTEQRIARGRRLAQYRLPEVIETSEEMAARLAERNAKIAAELDAIRNPPLEERFARIVGRAYAGCRLDNFVIDEKWEPHQRQRATEIIARLGKIANNIEGACEAGVGIILTGEPGVGKDHLIAGVMWYGVKAGLRCKWTNGSAFSSSAQEQFTDARLPERQWMSDWIGPDILTISDPDTNRIDGPTANTLDCLYKVVDARLRDKKHTWITINGSKAETWISRLSPRVWDRLMGNSWPLHCNWPGSRKPRGTV